MRISELIEKLAEMQAEFGDVQVVFETIDESKVGDYWFSVKNVGYMNVKEFREFISAEDDVGFVALLS